MAETFAVLGTDDPAWDEVMAFMPFDLRDVHFTSAWGRLQETDHAAAYLAVRKDDWFTIAQPFLLRTIPGSDYLDVTAVGYGGPISNADLLGPNEGAEFQSQLAGWYAEHNVISEFYAINPVMTRDQLPLIPRDWTLTYERAVTIIPTVMGDANLKDNRRQSVKHGAGAEIARDLAPEIFAVLYADAMERKNAAPRWRLSADYFERMHTELGPAMGIVGAFKSPTHMRPEAAAVFLAGGATAYYHLAARAMDAPDGYADQVILSALDYFEHHTVSAYLHLGGGLKDGDGLDAYKSSFGGYRRPVYSVRRVLDEVAYHELVGGYGAYPNPFLGFFPAYRAKEAQPA